MILFYTSDVFYMFLEFERSVRETYYINFNIKFFLIKRFFFF